MKEFRVSLPNQPGQLARLSQALGKRGVNILTVAVIGTTELVKTVILVTDQEEDTRTILQGLGLHHDEVEILTISIPDQPGELGRFTKKLGAANINIDSIYMLSKAGKNVKLAFSVNEVDRAKQILGL